MSRRSIAIVWLPVGSVGALFVFLLTINDRLPEQVATHWSSGGRADGFTDAAVLPYIAVGITLVVWGLLAAVSNVTRHSVVGPQFAIGLPLGMVWFIGALIVLSVSIQIDTSVTPRLPGWSIPLSLAIGLLGWYLAMLVGGSDKPVETTRDPAPPDAPRLDLARGSTVVWSGRTPQASIMPLVAAAVTLLGLLIGWLASWWVSLIFIPIVALLIGSTTYRVTAGPRQIEARGLLFGVPRVRIALDQVASVEAGSVNAFDFGGWGIRANLDGESAVVTRSGPALVIRRTDGALLRISLDNPEDVVPVISTLLDRRS